MVSYAENDLSDKSVENSPVQVSNGESLTMKSANSTNGSVAVDGSRSKGSTPTGKRPKADSIVKSQDIRNFFLAATKKRSHSTEAPDPPDLKRSKVVNGEAAENGVNSSEDSVEGSDVFARGRQQNGAAERSAKVTQSQDELIAACRKRTVKVVATRLEETEHFSEVVKGQLEKWKELKRSEGEAYEVEAILDYSWCKETHQGLYKVKWVGWEELTWEPLQHLEDCSDALKNFYTKRLAEREAAQPGRKRFLEVPPDPRTCFEKRSEFLNKICPPPCQSELETFFMKTQQAEMKMWPPKTFDAEVEKLQKSRNPKPDKLDKIKEQIMLRHVKDKRRDQLQRLKDWEVEINIDSADAALLKVENEVDLEGPPRHMTYINTYLPSPGITIPDDPPLGCECEDGTCESKKEESCCPGMNGHYFPYTKFGKIRVGVGTPIYECNKRCKCSNKCYNRVVQKGRKVKLCIYRTSNGCGWGVKALEAIKKGSFVTEYVGEVITSEEAEERGKKYDAEGKTYLFDLDFNLRDNNPYTVDAALYGNVAHFINHSCDPNMAIFNVWIDCLDPNLPRLCFFAVRDIARGEQLTFDYKQQTGQEEPPPEEEEESVEPELTAGQSECRCGSEKCRKIIF